MVTVILAAIICLVMILSVLFFPSIKLGKIRVSSYWVITLVGAAIILIFGLADFDAVIKAFTENSAVNPLKILVLFICMTILSVFLDELGFFSYLATVVMKRAHGGQKRLFTILYLTVSALTIFTSNDIIILSFTPFICYFAANAKIDPIPYLAAEFVAANTWSMVLIIGNPTNIYLASAYGIDFLGYLKLSVIPTVLAGIVAFFMLYLMFRKKLSQPVEGVSGNCVIKDKLLLWIGLICLGGCTLLLAISSYIGLEMWIVSLCFAALLFAATITASLIRRKRPAALFGCLKRAPYPLIPFMLSMFVIIIALNQSGITTSLAKLLGNDFVILKYGVTSALSANLINNIPMSVLFASVIAQADAASSLPAMFATVIGSNIGAFITPIGALAGIMWSSILNVNGIKFGYLDFLKIGLTVALPTLAAALCGLYLSVMLF